MPKKYDAELTQYWLSRDGKPYSQLLPHSFTYLVTPIYVGNTNRMAFSCDHCWPQESRL
jgi:hypothetical protein